MTAAADARSKTEAAFAHAMTLAEFGYAEIAIAMGMSHDWTRKVVREWRRAGLLEELRTGHKLRAMWRVKPDAKPVLAVRARSPEQNMWTAMRKLKGGFGPREIAAHAATEEVEVTAEAAQDYCRALLGAGYLAVARKAVPGKLEAIYRLVKNTGPRAPREKRVRAVVDANTEQTIVISGVIGGGQ